MNDAELKDLLDRINHGDEHSFEILIERYRPLLTSVAASFEASAKEEGIFGIYPELYQDLTLSLYRAAVTFDSVQNKVTFGKYAKKCAENCAISALRKYRTAARRDRKVKSNLKKEQKSSRFISDLPAADAASLLSQVKDDLSSYEFDVLSKYLDGMKIADIAKETGKSAKSVSNAVFRCKAKVRERYSDQK